MTHDVRAAGGRSQFTSLVIAVGLGVLYAGAEFVRQKWWIPSPLGVPGDTGGDPLAYLALGIAVIATPTLLCILLLSFALPRVITRWLALGAGLFPTAYLVIERKADLAKWEWASFDVVGAAGTYRLLAVAILVALVCAAPLLLPIRVFDLGPKRLPWRLALLVVAAWVFLGVSIGIGPGYAPVNREAVVASDAPEGAPNVLLLTIDTLRQDSFRVYGGSEDTALDAWIAEAAVYDGWASSPWTQPSMASLFTALAPSGHGCSRENEPSDQAAWWVESLHAQGYKTASFVSNPYLHRRFGFDRGFDVIDHADEVERFEPIARTLWAEWAARIWVNHMRTDRADRIVGRAREWLEENQDEGPWLVWVHLLDPHLPYHHRGENGALVGDTDEAWLKPLGQHAALGRFSGVYKIREGDFGERPGEREGLRKLYDSEVDFASYWSAQLMDAAREGSGTRPFVWVLTSDHGEEFWDDGGFEHGHTTHESVIRVPLVIGGTKARGPSGPMRLVDVGPEILDTIGIADSFDPDTSSGLLETDEKLLRFAVGRITDPVADDCSLPELLVESMLYGPERTVFMGGRGTQLMRDEESRQLQVRELCDQPDSTFTAPWIELDLWRERMSDLAKRRVVDRDLERRLRALGYTQ